MGAIAASVMAIIILAIFINKPRPALFTAGSATENIKLKDNSQVTLFANTTLVVAPDFNKKNRTVTLRGDAFFDIAKNPQKPFVIHSGDVDVAVLGTSFTIQQNARFQTVFVHSGKVKATFQNQSVTATAQQKIVKDNSTRQLKVVALQTNIEAVLKSRLLRVKDDRIDSVVRMVEDLYNVEVETASELKGKKITSTYVIGVETPDQIIDGIAVTIGASWSKNNNRYFITK